MSEMTKCATSGLLVPEGYCSGRVEGDCIHATRAREQVETMVELHRQAGLPPPIMGGARCGCVTPEILGCACVGQSSDSVALSGTASAANPWTWDLRVDPAAGNAASVSAAGLFVAGGALVDVAVFGSNDEFVKATYPNLARVLVFATGGGGAGGGATVTAVGQHSVGSGGGGGGTGIKLIPGSALSASEVVTIGSGGLGVNGQAGNAGNSTSFGAHVSGLGGAGGFTLAAQTGSVSIRGNNGGLATGADYTVRGMDGGAGWLIVASPVFMSLGGQGGNAYLGDGRTPNAGSGDGRDAAGGTGGGGSGARNASDQSSTVRGGNGGSGACIVYVFA